MTSRDFVYWLQGYFELVRARKEPGELALDETQTETIERHLAMVFVHEIDPSHGTKEQQEKLQQVHDGDQPSVPKPNAEELLEEIRKLTVRYKLNELAKEPPARNDRDTLFTC